MSRIPRWRMGSGIYHVLNRGLNNSWILSSDNDRRIFHQLLVSQKRKFKLNIYHYVIMSNHFHLAIEALAIRELSAYMGSVCSLYSRYWHFGHGNGRGTIWQGRFKSVVVQKENYMNRLGRYIERNPIVAKMENVSRPEDYPWSSAGAYVNDRDDPLIDVSLHPYWNTRGETDAERRNSYVGFLSSPDEESIELFDGKGNIVGNDDFKAAVRLTDGRHVARNVGRPRKSKSSKANN